MEEDKFYENIQKALENLPDNFSILEEQIDIDIQIKYFEFAKKIRAKKKPDEYFEKREELFNQETETERKREILSAIATLDDVKAYRILEKFVNETEGELKKWAILAMQESRMLIQSSLLDEQQVFISTGLGGKGKKLRYYVVFINQNTFKALNKTQQKLLKNELIYELKANNGEFETMDFMEGFSTSLVMLPLQTDIKNIFRNVIDECNQYGNFLEEDMIITNVKVMSRGEIIQMLSKNKDQDFHELEEK